MEERKQSKATEGVVWKHSTNKTKIEIVELIEKKLRVTITISKLLLGSLHNSKKREPIARSS